MPLIKFNLDPYELAPTMEELGVNLIQDLEYVSEGDIEHLKPVVRGKLKKMIASVKGPEQPLSAGAAHAGALDADQLLLTGYQSISVQALEELLDFAMQMLRAQGVVEPARGYNSEHLKRCLARNRIHLPNIMEAKFSMDPPDHVITYMWLGTSLRELLAILKRLHRGRFADGQGKVWLDVVFNDQRSPQAIEEAVKRANTTYLTARGHVIIISEAEYPVVQGAEAAGGAVQMVSCELWERCWCVLEMVVRYLAEKKV